MSSLQPEATVAAPLLVKPVSCLSDTISHHVRYLTRFKDNHKSLAMKMDILRSRRNDVNNKIENEEASQQMKHTHAVTQWLGKKVYKQLNPVEELINQLDKFTVLTDKLPPQFLVLPEGQTVGMNDMFGEVWSCVADDEVRVIGIYGMGGVGKTTLLKKIHNKFEAEEEARKFHRVIWVEVNRQSSDLENIQKKIGKALQLEWSEDDEQTNRAQRIYNVLSKKKFLLLLDDVWESMDLEAIGIPSRSNSKLVFTTRSESICGATGVNKKFKVPFLDPEQAWELFQQKVGYEVANFHSEILEYAREVAKECFGLPLALITTGRAMSTKKSPHEWRHAITMLRRYMSEFSGMEKVFSVLKFSYDSLDDDTARNCFLYWSLFEQKFYKIDVEFIIYCWIGEGFLDGFHDLDEAIGKGHDIIGSLKAACLLEIDDNAKEPTFRMHDVVHDLALWIGCECGKNKNKYLVQDGNEFTKAPSFERWKDAERISLTNNLINNNLDGTPDCPHLLTLIFREMLFFNLFPDAFFQYMPNLRVLILSNSAIVNLPKSIGCLLQLQHLDLSDTDIKAVPDEFGKLVKLKYLDLNGSKIESMPHGMISLFSRLRVLRLGLVTLDGSMAAELEPLDQLRELGVSIAEPSVHISKRLRSCITVMRLQYCIGLTELGLLSSSLLRETGRLCELVMYKCSDLEKFTINCLEGDTDAMGPLFTIKTLELRGLLELNNVLWDETATHLHFKHLSTVVIKKCHGLKDISWLVLAPSLIDISIVDCIGVEEVILDMFATVAIQNLNVFSSLRFLKLERLPRLKSIMRAALPFLHLRNLTVIKCRLLKKLPFASNTNNRCALRRIEGAAEWWNELQWEDETLQSSLQPYFHDNDNKYCDYDESDLEYYDGSDPESSESGPVSDDEYKEEPFVERKRKHYRMKGSSSLSNSSCTAVGTQTPGGSSMFQSSDQQNPATNIPSFHFAGGSFSMGTGAGGDSNSGRTFKSKRNNISRKSGPGKKLPRNKKVQNQEGLV